MTNEISSLIRNIRESKNITRKSLSTGICSDDMLAKIEAGTRIPSKELRDRLLARLGLSDHEFEDFLTPDVYERWEFRMQVINHILNQDIDNAYAALHNYDRTLTKQNHIAQQFSLMMHAQLMKLQGAKVAELHEMYAKAIRLTIPHTSLKRMKEAHLAIEEINILLEYIDSSADDSMRVFGLYPVQMVQECISYIESNGFDKMLLSKIHAKAVVVLARLKHRFHEENEHLLYMAQLCHSSVELLRDAERSYYLYEILTVYEDILTRLMDYYHDDTRRDTWAETLDSVRSWNSTYDSICRRYGHDPLMKNDCYLYHNTEVYEIGDVIKKRRMTLGLSQKSLSEISGCSEKTIIRIEHGRTRIQTEVFEDVFSALGLPAVFSKAEIITDSADALSLLDQYREITLGRVSGDNAEVLSKLQSLLNMNIIVNRQFIASRELRIKMKSGELSAEQYLEKMHDLLSLSLSITPDALFDNTPLFLSQEEIVCLFHMAAAANNAFTNQAIDLFESLFRQYNERYQVTDYIIIYELIMSWVASYKGNHEEYENSNNISNVIINACLQTRRLRHLYINHYNIVWNAFTDNTNVLNKEERNNFLKQLDECIYLSDFCRRYGSKKIFTAFKEKVCG